MIQEGTLVRLWQEPYLPETFSLIQKAKDMKFSDEMKPFEERIKNDIYNMVFSTDRYVMLPELCKEIDNGVTVIADRSFISTLCYQKMCGDDFLAQTSIFVEDPTIVILLDLEPDIAYNRIMRRDNGVIDPFEKKSNLERVRNDYLDVIDMIPSPVVVVDADRGVEEILADVVEIIHKITKV